MSDMIFIVSLLMWCLSLFGQQRLASPYSRSCAAERMKIAITYASYAASRTLSTFKLMSLCTMASADCLFRQDAYLRRASVIAHIRCAKERKQAKQAQDSEYVNGEKLSVHQVLPSARRLGMPPNCIRSHLHKSAPRQTRESLRSGRGAGTLNIGYKWSKILPAMKPRLPPDLLFPGNSSPG